MICHTCSQELELNFVTADFEKFYHCKDCDKWYELSKAKAKVNGAVPMLFVELENRPLIPTAGKNPVYFN